MDSDIIFYMGTYTYIAKIKLVKEDGKEYYFVKFPALKGCITYGHTFEEAVYMAKDLLQGYIEWLKKDGIPVPSEKSSLFKKKSRMLNVPISVAV